MIKNRQKLNKQLSQDHGPDTEVDSARRKLLVEEALKHFKPRPLPNPARLNQLFPDDIETKVDEHLKIKRDIYNRRGQVVKTDYIGYSPRERLARQKSKLLLERQGTPEDSPNKDTVDQGTGLKGGQSIRPASARSGATQQTLKTMTQYSGPTNYTSEAKALGGRQSQALIYRLADDTKLIDLIAEDTTLGRDQNIKAKEGSSVMTQMKIQGGVNLTQYQATQKGREQARRAREGKEAKELQEEEHHHCDGHSDFKGL